MIHEDITISGSFQASGSFILPRIPSNSLATATTGSMFYDTVNDVVKIYTGTGSTTDGYITVGAQSEPASPGGGGGGSDDIDYLVIAGAGGGGFTAGGGGGAGGLRTSFGSTSGGGASAENTLSSIASGSIITVTVGAGGAGASNNSSQGTSGGNSSISGTGFTTITSIGGGGGGTRGSGKYSGLSGGSGGGEGGDNSGDGGDGTSGQGFAGGSNSNGGTGAAGGGGAAQAGSAHSGNSGGNGGAGLEVNIVGGTGNYYAGGGGGGGQNNYNAGSGGTGGGGTGGTNAAGSSGTANTGGGGGGDGNLDNNGGTGGSGVAILTYPTASITAVGGTKTSTADGKFVHIFKESGTLTVGGSTFHTIAPGNYFNTLLYTGNDSNDRDIIGLGFQPDFVWIKRRNSSESHAIYDSVRGANKQLSSDQSIVEATNAGSYLGMSSFDSDGFNVGNNGGTNRAPNTYVAWSWKAGGNSNTFNIDGTGYASAAAAGLDDGSLTPTGASVNTTSGFSIIKVTSGGSTADVTVSHGLGVKPSFVIFKKLNSEGGGWFTWHKDFPNETDYLYLNDSYKLSNLTQSANAWGNRSFDYEVVSFRQGWTVETNRDVIIYSFADIDNYQKAGSYDGTGNANNQVTVGFRPRFLIIKSDSEAEPWFLLDSTRDTGNPRDNRLMADSSAAEDDGSVHTVDFTDTGFTANSTTGNGTNGNNVSYVYLAIA